jgi:hypothetical protein
MRDHVANPVAKPENGRMETAVRVYTSLDEMKADDTATGRGERPMSE